MDEGHTKPGTRQTKTYIIKDHLMRGLYKKDLPCQEVDTDEDGVLGYGGGIAECVESKSPNCTRKKYKYN